MPVWHVTEPTVALWLSDKPFWYQPSRGPNMAFELFYRRPSIAVGQESFLWDAQMPHIFSFGTNWTSPWRAFVAKTRVHPSSHGVTYFVFTGSGGVLNFPGKTDSSGDPLAVSGPDSQSRSFLNYTNNVFTLVRADGRRDIYDVQVDLTDEVSEIAKLWFVGKRDSRDGHRTTFEYATNNNKVKLTKVKDVDNREITFTYTAGGFYSNVVTQVSGPFGLSAALTYDGNDFLTNLVDTIGISSGIAYGATQNRLSRLVTPYGTNEFFYLEFAQAQIMRVVEKGVRTHLYCYYGNDKTPLPYPTVPSVTVGTTSSRFVNDASSDGFNSFYWSPRAYSQLRSEFRDALENLDTWGDVDADYHLARWRRWLVRKWLGDGGTPSAESSLAFGLERGPSSDGNSLTNCLYTWMDYDGQTAWGIRADSAMEGTSQAPRFVVKADHDGNVFQIKLNVRDANQKATHKVEAYTSPTTGSMLYRTNKLLWAANGVDLLSRHLLIGGTSKLISSNVFNADHQAMTNYNALSEPTYSLFDGSHRLTSIALPSGLIITNTYGADGFVATRTHKNSSTTFYTESFSYTNGMPLSYTDGRGMTNTYVYDKLGRLLKTTFPDSTFSTNSTFITNIYVNLDLVTQIDRMGFTNGWAYDRHRQVQYITNSNFKITTNSYCDCGSLESVSDPMGNTTTFAYDNLSRVTTRTFPGGTRITNGWDLLNRIHWTTDTTGAGTTNTYTIQGLVANVVGPDGVERQSVFDIEDQETITLDRNGVTVWSSFDELGRLKSRSYTNSTSEKWTYSARGAIGYTNQATVTVSKITLDELGRKTGETNALSEVVKYSYSGVGDLLTLTDGKNQVTTWSYDRYGRLTNKVDAASQTILKYTYDVNHRMTNRWSGKGTTKYVYDSVGNLLSVDYPASTDLTFKYDAANRMTNMVDAVGNSSFNYTSFGALAGEDGPWEADTISNTYTTNRLRSGLALTLPGGGRWSQSYAYDSSKRLTSLTSPAGDFGYQYKWVGASAQPAGLVSKITLPNGLSITNDYDNLGRQTKSHLKDVSGATYINRHDYVYDNANRRTNHTRWNGDFVGYTYDAMGQIKTAYAKESGGTDRQHEKLGYFYDASGNLSRRTNNTLTQTFNTANTLNQLSTVTRDTNLAFMVEGTTTSSATSVSVNGSAATLYGDKTFSISATASAAAKTFTATATDSSGRQSTDAITVTFPATVTFSYDLDGNLLNDGKRYFVYDDENQLTQVYETNKWRSLFVYDGKLRRRICKEYTWTTTWVQTNELRYIYDGNLVIQERDSSNLPLVTYTRGKDLSGTLAGAGGIGGLLGRTDQSTQEHTYYHSDAIGNVTLLIDSKKQPAARYLYDAFGNPLAVSGRLGELNRYRFSSKEIHPLSGLVYYLYRFYDPNLQRWPNRDPINESGFKVLASHTAGFNVEEEKNLFRMVRNNPVRYRDPFGLDSPGCDPPANKLCEKFPKNRDCFLRCCAEHDKCYFDNGCSASSWLEGEYEKCNICNAIAGVCVTMCKLGQGKPPTGARWFCGNGPFKGRFFDDYSQIPASCWENGIKPPETGKRD
jgi:RHS repeat-associated protein